jgi:penicillin-binding protein 2
MAGPGNSDGLSRGKALVFASIALLIISAYLVRLFSMQVVDNYIYREQADEVSRRSERIPTRRGEIFDRNFDQPLVTNIDTFAVLLDLSSVPADGLQELIERLAEYLNTESSYIWSRIPAVRNQSFSAYEIWSGASYHQIARIAENIDRFPGVSWESRATRYYTQGALLAHVLGYTGEITAEELQILYNEGYAGAREIGKTGVERQYDNILRGEDGIRFGRVDARGRRIYDLEDIPPTLGNSIVLTIDRHIQDLVEMALGPRNGAALVLDPSNGEILAMASYPDYDPNIFYTSELEGSIQALYDDPRSPLLNRTIQAAGSPASTFKTLMTAALLQEGTFDPHDEIFCPGYVQVGDRIFRCHDLDGHGSLDLYEALAESCNVYFYTIGKDYLGVQAIVDYSHQFGLGDVSGIDLPGEVRGLLPDPEWKERTYGVPWVGGDTVNMSIGQGFMTVTPLQMANLVAGIINDGTIYQPHVLKEIRYQDSLELIQRFEPRVLRDVGVSPEVLEQVRIAMRGVITEGTANVVITTRDTEVAGKTGTGQSGQEDYKHSWFIAYAPFNAQPGESQYVVVVWVDATNEWEWWAPKAANIIIHGITNNMTFEEAVEDLQPLWYMTRTQLREYLESIDAGGIEE